ncbi:MAG: hypothetical protein ACYTAF_17495 [Planctomycetota bacterium]
MADQKFTLIDVMRGIRRHGLIDKMSDATFIFLIGLILEANELGFKNPIGLTVNQALPIGGGNSRQTLNGRRKSLAKVRIEGKQLVTIKAGNMGQNSVATYEIDYDLLCSHNDVWQEPGSPPSRKFDSSINSPLSDHPTPQPHVTPQPAYHPKIRSDQKRASPPHGTRTILRSEEKREEIHTHTKVNNVTTGEGVEKKNNTGGDGFVLTEEKTEEDLEKAMRELAAHQVKEPARSELAEKYETRYLLRQMAQLKKDFQKGIKFANPGGVLVARIRKGHTTEDYPE